MWSAAAVLVAGGASLLVGRGLWGALDRSTQRGARLEFVRGHEFQRAFGHERSHGVFALFTSSAPLPKCPSCAQAARVLALTAARAATDVRFIALDYAMDAATFQALGVSKAPVLMWLAPGDGTSTPAPVVLESGATTHEMVAFVERSADIALAPDSKMPPLAVVLGVALVVAGILAARPRLAVGAATLVAPLAVIYLCSGARWVAIRNAPLMAAPGSGRPVANMTGMVGVEACVVFVINATLFALFVYLSGDSKKGVVGTSVACALAVALLGYETLYFRVKLPSYPYRVLY